MKHFFKKITFLLLMFGVAHSFGMLQIKSFAQKLVVPVALCVAGPLCFQATKSSSELVNASSDRNAITYHHGTRGCLNTRIATLRKTVEACDKNEVIGYVTYGCNKKEDSLGRCAEQDRCCISRIRVSDEYRRRGVGQELVKRVLEDLRDEGCRDISLNAINSGSIAFFKKQGAVPTHEPVCYFAGELGEVNCFAAMKFTWQKPRCDA